MNKCIIIGRLVRDVELKTLGQSDTAVVNNAIAVSRFRQAQNGERIEETLFLDVAFFNRYAEVVSQYLRKGSKLAVEGFLKQESWVDNNGQNRSRIVLIVESMEMLDNKQDNQNNQGSYQNNYQQPKQTQANNYQQGQNNYQQPQQNYQSNNYQQPKQNQANNYQQGGADELPW